MTAKKARKDAHLWERDPDDWYVEPRWCSEGLFHKEKFAGQITDPSCGLGRVLDAAAKYGYDTVGADIRDRGTRARHKFLIANFLEHDLCFENIVTNPPYLHADAFAAECVKRSVKCALLLRAQWANAGNRSRWLESLPLRRVLQISPRPSMPPGAVILDRIARGARGDPQGGQQDYAWYIFERGYKGEPGYGWCRRPPAQSSLFEAAA